MWHPQRDQDNHKRNWGSAADTRTGVVATSLTKNNILEALRNRNVYATEDKNLKVIMKVNGNLMGSILSNGFPSVGEPLNITAELNDPDEPSALYTIDVYSDRIGGNEVADVVQQVLHEGNGTISITGVPFGGEGQYLYLKIIQTNQDGEERARAWTAPVWFESGEVVANEIRLTMEVNVFTEVVTISNVGNSDVDISGWKLISETGNQEFVFPASTIIKTDSFLNVTSGRNAVETDNSIIWSKRYIWNNDGDPAILSNGEYQIKLD